MKIGTPIFAVGDRLESERCLELRRLAYCPILDRAQFGRRQLTLIESLAGLENGARAQQAADMVGAERRIETSKHCVSSLATAQF